METPQGPLLIGLAVAFTAQVTVTAEDCKTANDSIPLMLLYFLIRKKTGKEPFGYRVTIPDSLEDLGMFGLESSESSHCNLPAQL